MSGVFLFPLSMYLILIVFYLILLLVPVSAITLLLWWIVALFLNDREARARGLQFLTFFGFASGVVQLIFYILEQKNHWTGILYPTLYMVLCLLLILVLLLSGKYSKLWGSFFVWLMMIGTIWFDEILGEWIMPLIKQDYWSVAWTVTVDFSWGIACILSLILTGVTYWYAMKVRKEA